MLSELNMLDGRMLTLTHTNQAYAAYASGEISREEYKEVVKHVCPTPGACPFMGTTNTMRAIAELLGLSSHWQKIRETGSV